MEEMPCRELVELVTDYLEGRLGASDRARFEAHLAECPGCERYLDQVRRTVEVLGRVGEDDLDPAAQRALLRAFRGWGRSQPGT